MDSYNHNNHSVQIILLIFFNLIRKKDKINFKTVLKVKNKKIKS